MVQDLQKASMWKRISAFLFDGILLMVVAVLCALALSGLVGYDGYIQQVDDAYLQYGEKYGVDLRMSIQEYEGLDETQRKTVDDAMAELNSDQQALHALSMTQQLSLLILSAGFLLGFALMEFVVPLLFGNGQTLGKKAFGIAVMHTSGVKLTAPLLFARTILGKYAVETMVPVFIVLMFFFGVMGLPGLIVLILLLVLQIGVMIGTYTNSAIHDLIGKTVVVDMGSQKIFNTYEEMLAYKKKKHEEKVAKETY